MFDAARDLVIQLFDGARQVTELHPNLPPLRVCTRGLSAHAHPELELVNVPPALAQEAATLLNLIADYSLNKRRLEPGSLWASRLPERFVVAATFHTANALLRVTDLAALPDTTAHTALSAIAVSRALTLDAADEKEAAVSILQAALQHFPSAPGPSIAINGGENINQNNNLAYLALSRFGIDEQDNYVRALERSEDLLRVEAGGVFPPPAKREVLARDAMLLLSSLHNAWSSLTGLPSPGDGVAFLLSPVVHLEGDDLVHALALGPASFRRAFYEGPVSKALKQQTALAAEIYAKHQATPAKLLALTRAATSDLYEEGFRFGEDNRPRRRLAMAILGKPPKHLPFLSRILASLGRDLLAGLNPDELRARYSLIDDSNLLASANAKLTALKEQEDEAILSAYRS